MNPRKFIGWDASPRRPCPGRPRTPRRCVPTGEIDRRVAVSTSPQGSPHSENSMRRTDAESVLAQRFDFAEAEKEFKRAIELNPNYATAHQWYSDSVLMPTGRLEAALAEIKRALEIDPLSPVINGVLGLAYNDSDHYHEAIEQLRRTIELEPGWYLAHLWLGDALEGHGDYSAAIAEYQNARQLGDDPAIQAGLAFAYAGSGNQNDARKMLEELNERSKKEEYVSSFAFAVAHVALGEKDEAMRWLEKAYQDGAGSDLESIQVDRRLASLHGYPRYEKLISLIFGPRKGGSPNTSN